MNGFYESGHQYSSSLWVHHINKINLWVLEVLRYNELNYVSYKLCNSGVEHESIWENSTLITASLIALWASSASMCCCDTTRYRQRLASLSQKWGLEIELPLSIMYRQSLGRLISAEYNLTASVRADKLRKSWWSWSPIFERFEQLLLSLIFNMSC